MLTYQNCRWNNSVILSELANFALLGCKCIRLACTSLEGGVTNAVQNTAVAVRDTYFPQQTVHHDSGRSGTQDIDHAIVTGHSVPS